ncbi:MAG: hypothetical protein HQL77_03885 [Magnetococcales bacterium]|nr:hypothetical protein [Magnetococcales bacterium]MBF0434497.1 hypothetical protein [Magnetococcales bacterium]
MNDGSLNPHSHASFGRAVGQPDLDALLSQLETRWGRVAKHIVDLEEENSFLQDRLRELEEQLGELDRQLQEAKQRV